MVCFAIFTPLRRTIMLEIPWIGVDNRATRFNGKMNNRNLKRVACESKVQIKKSVCQQMTQICTVRFLY